MYKSTFIEYIVEYTDIDIDILNNIDESMYKNMYNFIIIQWNKCINNIIINKNIKNKNYKLIKSELTNINEETFYRMLIEFVDNKNIMKIVFISHCIDKYLHL